MDRQCPSCGGFCKKSGCERENVKREHEPVAWIRDKAMWCTGELLLRSIGAETEIPLYTAQPKKEWVGLTDEEIIKCFDSVAFGQVEDDLIINKHVNIFRAIHGIEAKLKEKNT